MTDAWFAEKLAPDGDFQDGCHPDEAQAIKVYLLKATTAEEAARALTKPITTATNPGEDLARLWSFIEDALVELPTEYTEALIVLLKAVEDLPEPDFSTVEQNKRPVHGKLWKGLPGFGHLWADSYQSASWRRTAKNSDPSERDALRAQHIRKAEIESRLVEAGLGGIPIDWGFEAVADALEKSDALLDFEVPAAEKWFQFCGVQFHKAALDMKHSWALKHRDLWTGTPNVMSLERWSSWEARVKDLLTDSNIGEAAESILGYMHTASSK